MKIINQTEYLSLRDELNEFVVLCRKYNYTPSKSEFDEIIKFILLNQTAIGALCESYEAEPQSLLNHLYESYDFDESNAINEKEDDDTNDFDSAVGTATTGVKAAGAGIAIAAGSVIDSGESVAMLIHYFFKKSKIKSMVEKELEAELQKLQGYGKLAELKMKLGELTDDEDVDIKWPSMATISSEK